MLSAKVKAVNKAHALAKELHEQLAPILGMLVGTKVFKADGSLTKKVQDMLPELPNRHDIQIYRVQSEYNLAWKVKVSEPDSGDPHGNHTVMYYDTTVYVAIVDCGILSAIQPFQENRTDWTVEEVKEKQKALVALRSLASDAEGALRPFEVYDR